MSATRVLHSNTILPTHRAGSHGGEFADAIPSWRKGIYSALGILTFIYLTTTVILFYLRRHKILDIQFRPLRLNLFNSLATIMLCVMFCFRSGFYPNEFPCFIIHWTSYIGFFLYFSALTCRVLSFTWVARYNIVKLRMSVSCNSNFHLPKTPKTPEGSMGEMGDFDFPSLRSMVRLKKFKRYATDKWLSTWVLYPILGFAFLLALVMQILMPQLSIRPVKTVCPVGAEKPTVMEVFDSSSSGTGSNQQTTLKSKKYELFEKVLEDARLFELYKACAAACFCTELILFLKEFQHLKVLVSRCCTPSNRELLPPPTPKLVFAETGHISFPETPRFPSMPLSPLSLSFITNTPCTKSIVETVTAASWIPFPYELKSNYKMFYDTFLNPDSDLSINFSGSLLNKVKEKIERGQYDLSMYESAREEVLTLLYVNTFEKFLKMYGPEIYRRKDIKIIGKCNFRNKSGKVLGVVGPIVELVKFLALSIPIVEMIFSRFLNKDIITEGEKMGADLNWH
ncbi:7965_t:CDS:2 [Acaulospora morrowiae]|uniref:7965_t:CDS:1 n=1 Tax=Acaulospora morrowiae TaxID=94023 RepID=A0A9N9CLY1_9GLOM|nr:7965_t:CDS:2 [Acaulospora morrowiae]